MFNGPLRTLNDRVGSAPIDAFICCASFEDRSKSIALNLDPKLIHNTWIAYNQDFWAFTEENVDAITSRFSEHHTLMKLDTTNPLLTADQIACNLSDLCTSGTSKRIVVDITSFTRESLLILLKFLNDRQFAGGTLEFLYANAKKYSVGDSSENKWLSKGNREIRSVLGYPGILVPSKQNHLIVLLGFEDERALSLIQEFEPSRISLGIGDGTEWATSSHQQTNVARLQRLKSILGPVAEFTFNGYDARATKTRIQEVISSATDYNTIIAPMNTKISTLGAAVVALENESIQICYARANIYNTKGYSTPGDHFFHLSLADIL